MLNLLFESSAGGASIVMEVLLMSWIFWVMILRRVAKSDDDVANDGVARKALACATRTKSIATKVMLEGVILEAAWSEK